MSSILADESNNSVAATWGRLVFLSVAVCSCTHCVAGTLSAWPLIHRRRDLSNHDSKSVASSVLFVPLCMILFFVIGVVYSFVVVTVPSLAIALMLYSLDGAALSNVDMTVYVIVLCSLSLYAGIGKVTNLYAM